VLEPPRELSVGGALDLAAAFEFLVMVREQVLADERQLEPVRKTVSEMDVESEVARDRLAGASAEQLAGSEAVDVAEEEVELRIRRQIK
jgi:hypothetical protein